MFTDLSPLRTLTEVRSIEYSDCDYTVTATAVAYFGTTSYTADLATYTFYSPSQELFVTWYYHQVTLDSLTPLETISFVGCYGCCADVADSYGHWNRRIRKFL